MTQLWGAAVLQVCSRVLVGFFFFRVHPPPLLVRIERDGATTDDHEPLSPPIIERAEQPIVPSRLAPRQHRAGHFEAARPLVEHAMIVAPPQIVLDLLLGVRTRAA